MAIFRDRPYPHANFLVDFGAGDSDSAAGGFSEVIMPAGEIEIVNYRNGNDRSRELRKAAAVRYDPVILRRGVTGALDLYQWWDQMRSGADARRTVTITMLNEVREPVLRVRLFNAIPVRYALPALIAASEETAIEELVLAYERLDIE